MKASAVYHAGTPAFLLRLAEAPEMQRLRGVGMNCGCEYTSFRRFRRLKPYSRFDHSLGAARIVWHFTEDPAQSVAALFHDIATPTFAHSVDFLRGDHLRQEATEVDTEKLIRSSQQITELLRQEGIDPGDVVDYHRYPIADNDPPGLSADRLEYTLGNLENYRLRPPLVLKLYYQNLTVAKNEDGLAELAFRDELVAIDFGFDALRCSRIYVSDEDRYAMQMLSELLSHAIGRGVLTESDLMGTENALIRKLLADPASAAEWKAFRALREIVTEPDLAPVERRRVIPAKLRCIDPLVASRGRLSSICPEFADELNSFRVTDQSAWLCAR